MLKLIAEDFIDIKKLILFYHFIKSLLIKRDVKKDVLRTIYIMI